MKICPNLIWLVADPRTINIYYYMTKIILKPVDIPLEFFNKACVICIIVQFVFLKEVIQESFLYQVSKIVSVAQYIQPNVSLQLTNSVSSRLVIDIQNEFSHRFIRLHINLPNIDPNPFYELRGLARILQTVSLVLLLLHLINIKVLITAYPLHNLSAYNFVFQTDIVSYFIIISNLIVDLHLSLASSILQIELQLVYCSVQEMLIQQRSLRREYRSEPTVNNHQPNQHNQDILGFQRGEVQKVSNISKFNCRDGPTQKQKATDCYCTAIYLLLTLTSIGLIIIFQSYSIQKFESPFDHKHTPCQNNQMLLLMPSYPSICVKNCPTFPNIHFICSHQNSPKFCPKSISNLKYNEELSLCFRYEFMKDKLNVPPLTRIIRSITNHSNVIFIVLGFVLVYCGLMLFTNLIIANSIVYIWIGIFQSIAMVMASACFYRFHCLINGTVKNSPFQYKNKHFFLVFGILFALNFMYGILSLLKKKNHLKFLVNIIKLSNIMFLDNWYLYFLMIAQLAVSLVMIFLNLKLIYVGLSFGKIDPLRTDPYNQIIPHAIRYFLLPLSILVFVWSYLICLNSSRFLLNCITIQWYFNQKLKGDDYDRLDNLKESIKLLYVHFGTVCYASLLSIIPRWLFKCLNFLKGSDSRTSQNPLFSIPLSNCCKYLSVYSHTYVILRSHQFNRANRQCCSLLDNVRSDSPQLYDLGDYYSRSAIAFFVLFSFGFSYYAIIIKHSESIDSFASIIPPILIVVLSSLMITIILMNYLGFVGDILVMMYQLDKQESKQFMRLSQIQKQLSAPKKLLEVLKQIDNPDS